MKVCKYKNFRNLYFKNNSKNTFKYKYKRVSDHVKSVVVSVSQRYKSYYVEQRRVKCDGAKPNMSPQYFKSACKNVLQHCGTVVGKSI